METPKPIHELPGGDIEAVEVDADDPACSAFLHDAPHGQNPELIDEGDER